MCDTDAKLGGCCLEGESVLNMLVHMHELGVSLTLGTYRDSYCTKTLAMEIQSTENKL